MFRPALFATLMAALLLTGGCDRRPDDVPVVVSAIGGEARRVDPSRRAMNFPSTVLMGATAQGLVRFDAAGQVEPGLAERWIVIDDGRSYIFRLRDAQWADGSDVTARAVVAALRRAIAPGSRNPLAPYLSAIDEVVEMTPEVIEIRLASPRPDLLSLLAQPQLALFRTRDLAGSGPFRIEESEEEPSEGEAEGDGVMLRPVPDPMALAEEEPEEPDPAEFVRLRGERAALAILRFARRRSDLVTGGTFAGWPLLDQVEIPPNSLRIDPAAGLFGLALVERGGFLAEPENRAAIAMAIDRPALLAAFRPDWTPVETVLPAQLDSAAVPARTGWQVFALDERRLAARVRVNAWRSEHPDAPPLRVALPDGPGSRLLWAYLAQAFRSIGLPAERVAYGADADLRLIDEVAPYDSARWYLATACRLCSEETEALLEAVSEAPDLAARAQRIAEADAAIADEVPYIPIAQPLRWSLVAQRLGAWQPNARARHPLNHLRNAPN